MDVLQEKNLLVGQTTALDYIQPQEIFFNWRGALIEPSDFPIYLWCMVYLRQVQPEKDRSKSQGTHYRSLQKTELH